MSFSAFSAIVLALLLFGGCVLPRFATYLFTSCTVCCGGGTVTCSGCPGSTAAAQWCIGPLSGFVGGCSVMNGASYTLTYQGSCIWKSANLTDTCNNGQHWQLVWGGASKGWSLALTNRWGFAAIPDVSFNCVAANTFTSVTGAFGCLTGGNCTSHPGTVVITPC